MIDGNEKLRCPMCQAPKDYIGCFDATSCQEAGKLCPAHTKSKQVVVSDKVLSVVNTRYQKSLKLLGAIQVQCCKKEDHRQ